MNFYDWITWAEDRHNFWCEHMEKYIDALPGHAPYHYARPVPEFKNTAARWAGQYQTKRNRCKYALPYIFMLKNEYDETIAHEVCHAYQKIVYPDSAWHGEMFHYMLRVICGFSGAKSTHTNYQPAVLQALKILYTGYELENPRDES